MKANELQIGDYVYNHRNWECPIVEIHKNSAVVIAKHYGEEEFLLSDLRPIPLTPEILEKNGFRIIFDGELHVSYFQDIESFHTEVKVDKMGIYQKLSMLDGLGNGVTIFECKYIHQLQHALHLCGIEKEIVI